LTSESEVGNRGARRPGAPVLQCPDCGAVLATVADGAYRCVASGHDFPVVRGVARFVGRSSYASSFGFQWARFARVQLDSANGTTRSRDTFTTKTGWSLDELRGERVLDAGCGMGRFTEICCDAGADVHAIDLSNAVEVAANNLRERPNAHFYQADILRLPFADESFDRVFKHWSASSHAGHQGGVSAARETGPARRTVRGLGLRHRSEGVRKRATEAADIPAPPAVHAASVADRDPDVLHTQDPAHRSGDLGHAADQPRG